ncbi:mandelate racemase/muconate lactonizing enzyme family protein [Jiangella anatolica]|uniref:Mandelate racemase n=1 Tax=Jiangella anatolica TaxID=2670374 RepID=A0A2W2BLN1_9ACTN|nr:mandelate racemase/muconate lactonizing enzyme family protein [Jiangella anatolica]PZF86260.1 mandelate racemase [Jiangella anatolica]
MKIVDVGIHVVAPMDTVEPVSGARLGWVFVEVHTDEGVTGVGECSNWPMHGDLLIARTLEIVRRDLIGRDPAHIERIWQELFHRQTYLGNRGLITTVISGIDQALWDIRGKVLDRPLYDLLGGPVWDDLLLYTHPWGTTPEEIVATTRQVVADGYTAIKHDPFAEMWRRFLDYRGGQISRRGIRDGAALTAAMREAVGPDVELLIDLHGNFNVATAIQCIRALEPYDIGWFEEPVPPEGLDALRQIRRQVDVPLCVGERLFTRWDVLPVLQDGLVNYVMPDVCWTGGVSELKKIATLAETFLVPISPHGAQGPVQIVAGAHVMATVPNFYRLEINSGWLESFNAAITPALEIRDGRLHLPARPGLGIELNHDFIADHPDPDWVRTP